MLDVVLGHERLLPCLNLKELLINVLSVGVDLIGIVLPYVEASKEPLEYKVENALLLGWSTGMTTRAGGTGLRWIMRSVGSLGA